MLWEMMDMGEEEMMDGSPYSHALFDVCRGDPFTELYDELGDLLDVDDIFALL